VYPSTLGRIRARFRRQCLTELLGEESGRGRLQRLKLCGRTLNDRSSLASRASLLDFQFESSRVRAGMAFLTANASAAIALEAGNDFDARDNADSVTMLAGVVTHNSWHSWHVLLPHYRHIHYSFRWRFYDCGVQLAVSEGPST
jgi:hypothetical protein